MSNKQITGRDKMRISRVINDWRNHLRPFEDTEYWSKRFAPFEHIWEKTRPQQPILLYRNERTDIDNNYETRFTSWSDNPDSIHNFGWGKRRMVWAYLRPEHILCQLAHFGPNIDGDQMREVIVRPGKYDILPFNKSDFFVRPGQPKPPKPMLSESVFKLTEMALKNEIIKKRAQVADNILSKVLEEISKKQVLQEEVFGAQAFVYHGSHHGPDEFIPMMLNNEFDPGNGSGAMYGKGLYCVYDLEDSATEYGNYGSYIYKFKVNLHGYIIFDDDITKKVYGKYLSIVEQAKLCGYSSHVIKFLEKGFRVESDGEISYSSDWARPASKVLSGLVKGLVFTGRHDGRVVVIYDASTAVPIAHKNLWFGGEWIKIDKQSLKDKLSRSASGDFDKEKYGKNAHMVDRMFKHNMSGVFNKIYEDKTTGLSLFSIETDKQAEFMKNGFPSFSKISNQKIKETILLAKDNEYGILAYDYYNRLVYRYENKLNTMSFNFIEPFLITNEIIKSLSNVIPDFINTISQKYYYEKLPDDGYIKKNESYHAYFDKYHSYHRDDGPAIIYNESEGGRIIWFQHGKIHRDDGPAIISPNGNEEWYKDGKQHRDNNLPAVVTKDGLKIWYRDGKLHRSNGPAVINEDGTEEYYILGHECSKEQYDEGIAALRKARIQIDENKTKIKLFLDQKNKTKFNNKSMNLFQLISEEIYK